jgi:hypothetical protein
MRNLLNLAMAMLLPLAIHAQYKGKISGKIIDVTSKQPLEGATISVLESLSGIYVKHAVSNAKGEFAVTSLPLDTALQVIISFAGYRDTTSTIRINRKITMLNTGIWTLNAGEDLDSVTVTARRAPFVVKKDTLEFNTSAFKSLPNDMVQDLLKKLPGIAIDEQGNVTVNGQKVDKLLVDGRDFFNPNIKTALENLPGSIIDKVQVTPSREKAKARTSLINTSDKSVTINLQLKKQNQSGRFGHVNSGYGTRKMYRVDASLNQFRDGNRWSILTNARKGTFSGKPGQFRSWGLNTNQNFGKKFTMDANYQGSFTKQEGIKDIERLNVLPDSNFLYKNATGLNEQNNDHVVNVNLDVNIDSLQKLNIQPQLNYEEKKIDNNSTANSTAINGDLINRQVNRNFNVARTLKFANSISYFRTSRDQRIQLSLNWMMSSQTTNSRFRNYSENYFENGKDTLDQYGNMRDSRMTNNLNFIITQKIARAFTAIFQYSLAGEYNVNTKSAFSRDNIFDSTISNYNKNTLVSHVPNVSIGYSWKSIVVEMGAGWTFLQQQNKMIWKDTSLKINQHSFTPRLNASWNFAKGASITMQYSVVTNAPTQTQLAPVQDNANPLYISKGNPNLHSSFTHTFDAGLQYYSKDMSWNGVLRGSGSITDNPIVSDNFFDDSGRLVSTWRNAQRNKNISLRYFIGRMMRVGKWNWIFSFDGDLVESEESGYINTLQNRANTTQFNPRITFKLRRDTKFSVLLAGGLECNRSTYTLSGVNNINFVNKVAAFQVDWTPIQKLTIVPSVTYYFNAQLPKGFQRSLVMLNTRINYSLLKANALSVGIELIDMLNSAISITRTVTPTAIETSQTSVIRRYGLLTLRYRFGKFEGEK